MKIEFTTYEILEILFALAERKEYTIQHLRAGDYNALDFGNVRTEGCVQFAISSIHELDSLIKRLREEYAK